MIQPQAHHLYLYSSIVAYSHRTLESSVSDFEVLCTWQRQSANNLRRLGQFAMDIYYRARDHHR